MATRLYQREVVVAPVKFTAFDCANCGVPFAVTEDFEERRRKDGKGFYCPNGHSNVFGETEADKVRKELAQAQERLAAEKGWSQHLTESLHSEQRSHSATKGQLTKTRKRIQGGVCPDCNRHFTNVERHMATKHPS